MRLYYSYTPDIQLEVSLVDTEEGLQVALRKPNTDEVTGFTIDRSLIEESIGSRGFDLGTHIYIHVDQETGQLKEVSNKVIATMVDKRGGKAYTKYRDDFVVAQVYIPYPDSPMEEWTVRFNVHPDLTNDLPEDIEEVGVTYEDLHSFAVAQYPKLEASVVSTVDGLSVIEVQLLEPDMTPSTRNGLRLFAKAVEGYVNKTETETVNGVATFKARRLDLDPEDIMTVEFGFKYTTNLASVNV